MLSFWEQDDRAERLKELWLAATPAKTIADEFGTTRSAVIGRAHRMGLAHKGPKQSTAGVPKKRQVVVNRGGAGLKPMKAAKPIPPRTPEQQTDENARILALKATCIGIDKFEPQSMCGYIHGEPSEQARCGRKKLDGLPYCEDHATLCKSPPAVARPYPSMRASLGARRDVQQVKTFLEFIDA